MTITHPLSRTCEALAAVEVHTLHALREHDLVDGTCGGEGKERKKDKVRNEEAGAAETQDRITRQVPSHVPVICMGLL